MRQTTKDSISGVVLVLLFFSLPILGSEEVADKILKAGQILIKSLSL